MIQTERDLVGPTVVLNDRIVIKKCTHISMCDPQAKLELY